jgi:hypothetical protein
METQITSNFIPLQQPYPVIKHLYKIGVQIGIQIVTVAFGTPFKIETHRYPVVAAEDDKNLSSIKDLTQLGGAAATPVVWDNVDVDNVLVLFKLNAELNWTDLIKLLWEDQAKYADPRQLLQTYMLMKLSSYCRSITLNAPGSCPIHLSLVTDADGQPLAVSSKHDDILALYAHWSDDAATMEGSILNNLQDYLLFVQQKMRIRWPFLLHYESTDERLSQLVERLNANPRTTSMRGILVTSITITADKPYKKDVPAPAPDPAPESEEPPQHGEYYFGEDVKIFNKNLDPKKIADAIIRIDHTGISLRPFILMLYETLTSFPGILVDKEKTKFVSWIKHNCQLYHESRDLKKVQLTKAEKEKIEEYKAIFAVKQLNGTWIFNKKFNLPDKT